MSIIKINVHPYVKKILIKKFGSEPIFARQNNIIGIMIRPLLTDKSEGKRVIRGEQSETLSILLPARLRHLSHNKNDKYSSGQAYFLEPGNEIKLKHALKKFVDYMLVNEIIVQMFKGASTMEAISAVYDMNDINEDIISRDTVMCLYKRHKRSLMKGYRELKQTEAGGNSCP